MDEIDITSAEYSLDIHHANKLVSETINNMSETVLLDGDYSMYIIGMIVLLLVGGLFAYFFYTKNMGKRVTFQDKLDYCYGQGQGNDGQGNDGQGNDIECNEGVCRRV